ncbi:MAG: IclR family transcriptional regulator, regulon repressor [Chloroflexota bacterium]|jgi:DNA-binding IclR family transcriptional regulator|nr:IclR family transcriptional regulator, regulon repressor [Chloroflexota bacterium]
MAVPPDRLFTQRTQAVQRALQVLDLFSLASPELSLQEISAQLGMAPSTTHRLLKTLEESGWLARVAGTELYRLGPRLLTLGGQMLMQYPVREVAAPHLRRLAHELGQTVGLARYDDGAVVYLDCVEGPGAINLTLRIGGRAPAHCVASGRALLAHMESGELLRIAARGLAPCIPDGRVDEEALILDLQRIRERGYAVDDGDWRPGVRAAAAAVLDSTRRPIVAVTAIGFAGDLTMERVDEIGRIVQGVAAQIARAMGYP